MPTPSQPSPAEKEIHEQNVAKEADKKDKNSGRKPKKTEEKQKPAMCDVAHSGQETANNPAKAVSEELTACEEAKELLQQIRKQKFKEAKETAEKIAQRMERIMAERW